MTVRELKEQINAIDEKYDDVEVVLPSGQYLEGYTPIGGVSVSGRYVVDNFAKDEDKGKQKHVVSVWLT